MDKMRMESVDITDQNIEKIGALFPNVITEATDKSGKLIKAINFELLKQELSKEIIDGDEAYEFTWVGKKAAIVEANKPIRKTLRPCKEESVNWDTTENLYIEGDNLEVLKLLQESYLGKIKMIYIDPPYNTGNDFIYDDDFKRSQDEYDEDSGAVDENGERMFKNTDSNGRFHSDWCSMIYSRLSLSRNLLSDDGVIIISIDDNEQENLKKICNEIFGEDNLLSQMVVRTSNQTGTNNIKKIHEYLLIYAKNKYEETGIKQLLVGMPKLQEARCTTGNPSQTQPELLFCKGLRVQGVPDGEYDEPIKTGGNEDIELVSGRIIVQDGKLAEDVVMKARWSCPTDIKQYVDKMRTGSNEKIFNKFKKELIELYLKGRRFQPILVKNGYEETVSIIESGKGSNDLKHFGLDKYFSYPKSVSLLESIISLYKTNDMVVLDFFSGSATTAQAIMQLNAKDSGRRRFIMVQLTEKCDESSDAYKAGYENICEIGKERIRRAAKKIHEEHPDAKFDDGFRVLKVDESNMTDVYYSADSYNQNMLNQLESNIKPDRTDLDLLFGCLLEWGLPLSMPYVSEDIEGCKVHTYNDGDLIACFDNDIPESVIKEIAKRKPLRAVFRDSGFKGSPEKINVGETFKLLSPDTRVKII